MIERIAAALLVAGALCAALPAAALADGSRIGVLGPVVPPVHVTLPDGSTHDAVTGEDAVVGEKIVTDAAGMTEILFLDRSSLRVGENSEITVSDFSYSAADGTGKLNVEARQGLLRFNGGALSKEPGRVTVRTPAAIMGIRGAIALIDIGAGGASQATLLYGNEITMTGTGGLSSDVTRVGYFSSVPAGGGAPTQQAPAGPAQLGTSLAKLNAGGAKADGAQSVAIGSDIGSGPAGGTTSLDTSFVFPGPPPGATAANQANALRAPAAPAVVVTTPAGGGPAIGGPGP